jgi:hypothetical protein
MGISGQNNTQKQQKKDITPNYGGISKENNN